MLSHSYPFLPDLAENWDEDFEFQANGSSAAPSPSSPSRPRISTSQIVTTSPLDPATPSSREQNDISNWAEPGPSTPLKRLQQTENWDDDFQDTESPKPSTSRASHLRTQNGVPRGTVGSSSPVENWDDEFEDGTTRHGPSPRRKTPRKRASWGSSEEEDEYAFGDREDDRTVTSRSRGMHFHMPTEIPPPVPPLPSPFPRSPTASVFSVPVSSTGRESSAGYSYSSTAHLALRPTISGSSAAVAARLALLPPSPPIHRERRRLRKKSRPPPNFEEGIFELDDRAEIVDPPRPVTPENITKKQRDLPTTSIDDPPEVGNTSTNKTPLLSRIGSVGKKWGAGRKKRASTGPSQVTVKEREEASIPDRHTESEGSRPTSFIASSSPGHGGAKNWFFRGGGGGQGPGSPPGREAPLKHERSVERLLHRMGVERGREPGSPSPRDIKGKGRIAHTREGTDQSDTLPSELEAALDGSGLPTSALLFGGNPRRPTSMQVSITNSSSGSSWSSRHPVPRHVSYTDGKARRPTTPSSRASSKQRSASASVEDVQRAKKSSTATTRDTHDDHSSDVHQTAFPEKPSTEEQKGSRRFMGGIRRISLVGSKHKRTKSIITEDNDKGRKPKLRPSTGSSTHENDNVDQSTPRPPSRIVRSSLDVPLLPPIELQPPSPPRNKGPRKPLMLDSANLATPTRNSIDRTLEPSRSHPTLSSRSPAPSISASTSHDTALPTIPSPLPSPTRPKASTSPVQTASLGRNAQIPKERDQSVNSAVLRRNSLGDLKIPARISQAQVSLRRDLTMVRDFATSVECKCRVLSAPLFIVSHIPSQT